MTQKKKHLLWLSIHIILIAIIAMQCLSLAELNKQIRTQDFVLERISAGETGILGNAVEDLLRIRNHLEASHSETK